jgi:hypothetical protein
MMADAAMQALDRVVTGNTLPASLTAHTPAKVSDGAADESIQRKSSLEIDHALHNHHA